MKMDLQPVPQNSSRCVRDVGVGDVKGRRMVRIANPVIVIISD